MKFVHFTEYGTIRDTSRNTALGFLRYYLTERMDALVTLIGSGEIPTPPFYPETTTTEISLTGGTGQIPIVTEQTTDTIQNAVTDISNDTTEPISTEEPMDGTSFPALLSGIFIAVFLLTVLSAVIILILVFKKKKR